MKTDLYNFNIWIFCSVIDNYGDAGVSWRLASILHKEHHAKIILFIDNLDTLSRLNKKISIYKTTQSVDHIQIVLWKKEILSENIHSWDSPNCLIEMFACSIDEWIITNLNKNCLWINYEYLSAEKWTLDYHLILSLQPSGIEKYFYFMGFAPESGGILYEEKFLAPQTKKKSTKIHPSSDLKIFIFTYHSESWLLYFEVLGEMNIPIQLILTDRKLYHTLNQNISSFPHIKITLVPFVEQEKFDDLLKQADIVFIRGEDSFIRAQLLSLPFIWHIYPQDDKAHKIKLDAFWKMMESKINSLLFSAIQAISNDLNKINSISKNECKYNWTILIQNIDLWRESMTEWKNNLLKYDSASEKLAYFIKKQLK